MVLLHWMMMVLGRVFCRDLPNNLWAAVLTLGERFWPVDGSNGGGLKGLIAAEFYSVPFTHSVSVDFFTGHHAQFPSY